MEYLLKNNRDLILNNVYSLNFNLHIYIYIYIYIYHEIKIFLKFKAYFFIYCNFLLKIINFII